jgi:hypothetical protein
MIPVIFNGWHSLVDFGGFSIEQLQWSSRNTPIFVPHRQYVRELVDAIRPAGGILMYDVSTEPFNNGGKGTGVVWTSCERWHSRFATSIPARRSRSAPSVVRDSGGRKTSTSSTRRRPRRASLLDPRHSGREARRERRGHEVYNEL